MAHVDIPVGLLYVLPVFLVIGSASSCTLIVLYCTLRAFISNVITLFVTRGECKVGLRVISTRRIGFCLGSDVPFFSSAFLVETCGAVGALILNFVLKSFTIKLCATTRGLRGTCSSFISPLLSRVFCPCFAEVGGVNETAGVMLLLYVTGAVTLTYVCFLSPCLVPVFVGARATDVAACFGLFLLLLTVDIPTSVFNFPCLNMLKGVGRMGVAAVCSTVVCVVIILILVLARDVDVKDIV